MRSGHLAVAGAAALFLAGTASSLSYTPPEEVVPVRLSGDDAEVVRANCMGCHSLDYIASQPTKDAAFWTATVHKMVTVYGAPVEPADADKVAAVLTATFGKAK